MPGKRKRSIEDDSGDEESPVIELNEKRDRRKSCSYKDSHFLQEEQFMAEMKNKRIQVKCNQTGKIFKVKISSLSKEEVDSPLCGDDFCQGRQLIMDFDKKSYPVTVMKVEEFHNGSKKKKVTSEDELQEVIEQAKSTFTDSDPDELIDASSSQSSSHNMSQLSTPRHHRHDEEYSPHLVMKKLKEIQGTLNSLVTTVNKLVHSSNHSGSSVEPVKSEHDSDKFIVDGINLKQIPARDPYAYGRNVLEVLFTKEELAQSVLFKTKKSDKPPLSPRRVQLLFDCLNTRYRDKYDQRQMTTTLSQKCRDSGRRSVA